MSFPASPSVGQQATEGGRLYSWTGYAWELVANVSSHAATHAAGGNDAITPASIGAVATSDNVAASKLTGTIADARLSGNAVLHSVLSGMRNQSTGLSYIDVLDRALVTTSAAPVSSAEYWTFFTAPYALTVSQIAMMNATAFSGVTLARMGLYTMDSAGAGTLVARTASDTTLFNVALTLYTRSFDTTGGFPASYTLVAGQRYATAVCVTATTLGNIQSTPTANGTGALVQPRIQGVRTGALDLVLTQGSGQYNGSVSTSYWARLS